LSACLKKITFFWKVSKSESKKSFHKTQKRFSEELPTFNFNNALEAILDIWYLGKLFNK
jgi:hypothetical protein